jgi:hypothetical protein
MAPTSKYCLQFETVSFLPHHLLQNTAMFNTQHSLKTSTVTNMQYGLDNMSYLSYLATFHGNSSSLSL